MERGLSERLLAAAQKLEGGTGTSMPYSTNLPASNYTGSSVGGGGGGGRNTVASDVRTAVADTTKSLTAGLNAFAYGAQSLAELTNLERARAEGFGSNLTAVKNLYRQFSNDPSSVNMVSYMREINAPYADVVGNVAEFLVPGPGEVMGAAKAVAGAAAAGARTAVQMGGDLIDTIVDTARRVDENLLRAGRGVVDQVAGANRQMQDLLELADVNLPSMEIGEELGASWLARRNYRGQEALGSKIKKLQEDVAANRIAPEAAFLNTLTTMPDVRYTPPRRGSYNALNDIHDFDLQRAVLDSNGNKIAQINIDGEYFAGENRLYIQSWTITPTSGWTDPITPAMTLANGRAIQQIMDLADATGTRINAYAMAFNHKAYTTEQLLEMYNSQGFELDRGPTATQPTSVIREPVPLDDSLRAAELNARRDPDIVPRSGIGGVPTAVYNAIKNNQAFDVSGISVRDLAKTSQPIADALTQIAQNFNQTTAHQMFDEIEKAYRGVLGLLMPDLQSVPADAMTYKLMQDIFSEMTDEIIFNGNIDEIIVADNIYMSAIEPLIP